MSDDGGKNTTRRRYLTAASAIALTALAGCNSGTDETEEDDDEDEESDPTETESTTDATSATATEADDSPLDDDPDLEGTTVELLHGWTGGDGKRAFEAMREGFEQQYEAELDVTEVGVNASLNTVVRQRVKNDNPPGSWAEWPGANLQQFVDGDALGDIEDDVWTPEVKDAYTDGARAMAKVDGEYVCVPTNVHRINNLFYNESILDAAGVDPSSLDGPRALLDAFETVESETDATPFAHSAKGPWTTLQLFASVFIGQHGSDAYESFVAGNGTRSQVEQVLETLVDYAEYMPNDAASSSFQRAGYMVQEGGAAFIHQGDWLAGMFDGGDFEFENGFGHVPYPGTKGVYQLNMDAWVYPAGTETPAGSEAWLEYLTTKDAQVRFNRPKGSVPPRTDVSTDEFGAFQTYQMEQYEASERQLPSLTHGLAVPEEKLSAVKTALSGEFDFTSRSVPDTARAFIDALDD